jgi:SAM-dependent methyltransferase
MSDFTAFRELEISGWSDPGRAAGYVELFAQASDQAIGPLLDAADARAGVNALDLCCGQGNVSEALVARGCQVTGADFSPAMLAMARARVPGANFIEADAQDLPLADGEFDIVVSNLGICHVPDQRRALRQAHRVLKKGGRFAMTVWCGADTPGGYEMLYRVFKQHGAPGISAPPGPDFHQFANPDTANALLTAAGFSDIGHAVLDCGWNLETPESFAPILERGTVRAAMLLSRQPPENLAAIRRAFANEIRDRFHSGGRWRVPAPAALVSATA